MHFAIVNESAAMFAICADMGGLANGRTDGLTYLLTHTIKSRDLNSVYYVTGRLGIKLRYQCNHYATMEFFQL